jgi:signal transduction histidine kinase
MRWQGFAWFVLVAALVATVGLSQFSRNEFSRRHADRFTYLAERQSTLLTDRIHDYERVLRGAAGLFAASGDVTRDEWRRYIERMELDRHLPGIQGTGFAQMVPASEKAAHEAAMRAEGHATYRIRPGGEREMYSAIVYLEPFNLRNQRAFGFDMFSEPVRRAAMERARDTGQPALTGKVRLVQETNVDVQPGFLIYTPVYRNDMPTATVAQRRAAIRGFVYSPFRSSDMMQSLFRDPRRDVEVEIYEGSRAPENLIYASSPTARAARNSIEQTIEIAGWPWVVHFRSSEEFEQRTRSHQPELILAVGVLLSLLLAGAIINDARHSRRLEKQVRERTRELEHARDEAESASRAKSAFLATVSHELRTPLNAIIGFSAILLDEPAVALPAEQRKQLQMINDSGRHLLDLIKDILDVTSIEAGQLTVHIKAVDLRGILEEQVASLQTLAADRSLVLRLEPPVASVDVLADATRLRQVLRNLIANAIKFTDHGSVALRQVVSGDMVRIEVVDTGIGIAPGDQALLFNPFQRIGDHTGSLRPGTGLGLAISRRLVEAMDGEIGCESASGKGSRFWFTLPIVRHGQAALRVS